jgi:hypothetical protein
MPPKKSQLAVSNLPEKPATEKDASSVKGGRSRDGRLSSNHNQTLRRRLAR